MSEGCSSSGDGTGRGARVASGVGASVGSGVGVAVATGCSHDPPGMKIVSPCAMLSALARLLPGKPLMASTSTPNRLAMSLSVSPGWTS